jgi:hypothetical protein
VEADAQIRLLHDQQRGVAAADGQEIGAAEEHGLPEPFAVLQFEVAEPGQR